MARNRKRAKERRSRRPASSQLSRPGVATARPEREREQHEREEREQHELEEREAHERETPSPIEHATPDVELAEAQLEVGRPDLADVNGESPAQAGAPEESVVDEPEEELDEQDFEDEEDFADEAMRARGTPDGAVTDARDGDSSASRHELATSASVAPTQRKLPGNRLFNFLQGSWRELQRVQWPDRRQVMQATGVVIGFVIVAGVYLGVADELAGKIVTFILK